MRRQVVRSPGETIKLGFLLIPFNLTCQLVDRVWDGRWEIGHGGAGASGAATDDYDRSTAAGRDSSANGLIAHEFLPSCLCLLTFVTSSITLQTLSVETGGTRTATSPRRRSNRQQR